MRRGWVVWLGCSLVLATLAAPVRAERDLTENELRDEMDRNRALSAYIERNGMPDLAAGVPFYGRQVSAEDAAKIKAPLLIHYAEKDDNVNKGWPAYEAALKANGVRYQVYIYPGTLHAFHNDTTPRYNEAAAKLSWSRTLAFFKQHLKG